MNFATWFAGHLLSPVLDPTTSTSERRAEHHGERLPAGGDASASGQPSTLAARDPEVEREAAACGGELWVVLTGAAVDREVVALACAMAGQRGASVLHAMYCIEVPRSLAVDEEMPRQRQVAAEALDRAAELAEQQHIRLERECLQVRCASEGVVRALERHACATLVLGMPYRADGEGEAQVSELAEEVLRVAPCRVYVVRGMPPIAQPGTNGPD